MPANSRPGVPITHSSASRMSSSSKWCRGRAEHHQHGEQGDARQQRDEQVARQSVEHAELSPCARAGPRPTAGSRSWRTPTAAAGAARHRSSAGRRTTPTPIGPAPRTGRRTRSPAAGRRAARNIRGGRLAAAQMIGSPIATPTQLLDEASEYGARRRPGSTRDDRRTAHHQADRAARSPRACRATALVRVAAGRAGPRGARQCRDGRRAAPGRGGREPGRARAVPAQPQVDRRHEAPSAASASRLTAAQTPRRAPGSRGTCRTTAPPGASSTVSPGRANPPPPRTTSVHRSIVVPATVNHRDIRRVSPQRLAICARSAPSSTTPRSRAARPTSRSRSSTAPLSWPPAIHTTRG